MDFVGLMQSTAGRMARVLVGLALIVTGFAFGGFGWILVVVGIVPLAMGVTGACLMAPLLHEPFHPVRHH